MILVTGSTGTLGKVLVPLLADDGYQVRALTRSGPKLAARANVEVVEGDARDPDRLARALSNVDIVLSAMTGFGGKPPESPATVDRDANKLLVRAAVDANVKHFVLVSILGASATHPIELFRMKWQAEQELRNSGLSWSIVRPSAYMETWLGILAALMIQSGKALVFGRGRNPINLVSAHDVARAVERTVRERKGGTILELGGPDDLSMQGVVETFSSVTGARGGIRRIPRPMLRVMSLAARPFNPLLARQAAAAVVMDSQDMRLSALLTGPLDRSFGTTSLTEVVKRDYSS